MALEPDNPSAAYQLGRLFAVLEFAAICCAWPGERSDKRLAITDRPRRPRRVCSARCCAGSVITSPMR